MSYKIAAASSDGKQIDETFGAAKKFIIYEVTDGSYKKLEERVFHEELTENCREAAALPDGSSLLDGSGTGGGCSSAGSVSSTGSGGECGAAGGYSCGAGIGCASGGSGSDGGCGGAGNGSAKVELISDCRCIVCKKIGFHIQKQLERKAISAFDVSCSVEEALEKISYYFKRIDNHESLRAQSSPGCRGKELLAVSAKG